MLVWKLPLWSSLTWWPLVLEILEVLEISLKTKNVLEMSLKSLNFMENKIRPWKPHIWCQNVLEILEFWKFLPYCPWNPWILTIFCKLSGRSCTFWNFFAKLKINHPEGFKIITIADNLSNFWYIVCLYGQFSFS